MQSITSISIPTPCHQQWEAMTPSNDGRHCDSCCKTVIDFTKMSDQQIINFLSGMQNTCGRIEPWQISSVNRQLGYRPRRTSFLKSMVVTMVLSLAVLMGYGQSRKKTPQRHKTELVIKNARPDRDSMQVFPQRIKAELPKTTTPVTRHEIPADMAKSCGPLVGGILTGLAIEDQNHKPIGYYRTLEDMMQVIAH